MEDEQDDRRGGNPMGDDRYMEDGANDGPEKFCAREGQFIKAMGKMVEQSSVTDPDGGDYPVFESRTDKPDDDRRSLPPAAAIPRTRPVVPAVGGSEINGQQGDDDAEVGEALREGPLFERFRREVSGRPKIGVPGSSKKNRSPGRTTLFGHR